LISLFLLLLFSLSLSLSLSDSINLGSLQLGILEDFLNLLGVSFLFHAFLAAAIPLYITNMTVKQIFTWIHVLKHFGFFLIRLKMFLGGQYHPITTGFAFSLALDGLLTIVFGLCALFPSRNHNVKSR
jgi:hypothetical protein